MNRVILKPQKEKSKEKDKKKEKKKQEQPQSFSVTQTEIETNLFNHFQNHIGEANKTTMEELFQVAIGVNPYQVNSYAKYYWLEVIKKVVRKLRRENTCFVIQKNGSFFVLETEEECEYYQGLCDNAIDRMEKAKLRAEIWVEDKMWKNMPSQKARFDTEKQKKKVISPEEKLDNVKETMRKKIIRLYKGETENEN